jgi:hypothetical protein
MGKKGYRERKIDGFVPKSARTRASTMGAEDEYLGTLTYPRSSKPHPIYIVYLCPMFRAYRYSYFPIPLATRVVSSPSITTCAMFATESPSQPYLGLSPQSSGMSFCMPRVTSRGKLGPLIDATRLFLDTEAHFLENLMVQVPSFSW